MTDETEKKRRNEAREDAARRRKAREEAARREDTPPPAGPHDRPDLINPDATPGTGALPSPDERKGEIDPGSR